ncbi:MAG: multicopper oxidase family protein [Pseudomonadota bacterium]
MGSTVIVASRGLFGIIAACLTLGSFAADESSKAAPNRPDFKNPPDVYSANGVLDYEMTVEPDTIEVGGKTVTTYLYNGLYAPATLHVRPGDQLRLTLNNKKDGTTNVHYHGTNVSPKSPQDNIFIGIAPGETYQYKVDFPDDHPQGLFYYHPHWHGTTEYQIGGGLSGLLSVGGVMEPWPELADITVRNIILRDIQIKDGKVPNPPDPGNPTMRLVNGLLNPSIPIRPGEVQLWRVGNVGADIFYDLEIDGHKLHEIARDGIRHNQPVVYDNILLPTSARTEFLIVGGDAGEYTFRTREINMGPGGDPHPRTTLATLVVSGKKSAGDPNLPSVFPPLQDLRKADACCDRTIDFSETPDGSQFCINNAWTDMDIVNTRVRIGCVEEWTINNCSAENHVFHHHQLQFQVVKRNGKDVPFAGWQDTVAVDFRSATEEFPDRCKCNADGSICKDCTCPTADDPHGSVVIRIPYTDPIIEGKAVYHCHIGEHEDAGMMSTIEMSPTAGQCEAGTPSSLNRLTLTPSNRAVCKPRKVAHAHDG